jgi:hypothetical protein
MTKHLLASQENRETLRGFVREGVYAYLNEYTLRLFGKEAMTPMALDIIAGGITDAVVQLSRTTNPALAQTVALNLLDTKE